MQPWQNGYALLCRLNPEIQGTFSGVFAALPPEGAVLAEMVCSPSSLASGNVDEMPARSRIANLPGASCGWASALVPDE
ncbi:hypothetical protein ACQ4W7_13300 [Janthinobacterium sp. MDT1-19]